MGDKRNYTDEHVKSLQGSVRIEHTLAKMGAKQLRDLFESEPYVNTFGAYNGCLLYTSPSPRDRTRSRMPSSA